MQSYAGMIEAMDHHIGRVVEHLKRSGTFDDTLIIFLSDNGPEGGNPLDWGGGSSPGKRGIKARRISGGGIHTVGPGPAGVT